MDSNALSNIIKYLHSCYVADNRELKLSDFFNVSKIEHRYIFDEKEELINGHSPKVALPEDYAAEVLKSVELYQKEKELLYTSIFILGKDQALGKKVRVCAPLIFFPATVKKEREYYFVYIDHANFKINESALNLLGASGEYISRFLKDLPDSPFDFGAVGKMLRHLKSEFTLLDTESMLMFPELWNEKKLKRQLQPKQRAQIEFFKMVPASGLGLVKKSSETFGILSELEQLENEKEYSRTIQTVFGKESKQGFYKKEKPALPAVLNVAQEQAVLNARFEDLSMIVGPPGTGKSYTIAAIALDHLMRGKSVLISSKQDEAVNVVGHKIAELLGTDEVIIRGGAKDNLRKMKKQVLQLLRKRVDKKVYNEGRSLYHLNRKLERLERKLEDRFEQELRWSESFLDESSIAKVRSGIIKTFHGWYDPHWKLLEQYRSLLDERIESSRQHILSNYDKGMVQLLRENRKLVEQLYQGLRKLRSSERDAMFGKMDHGVLLGAFPIWLSKLSDLYRILPQQKHLFDLVIIDEASQCDMATALPALQRGKRAVVVGDPNQLRHVSFLSDSKMNYLKDQASMKIDSILNFREMSFLDLVSSGIQSQQQVTFLDEHYRSVPEIIQFSNREFYSSSLKIMTQRPVQDPDLGVFPEFVGGKRNEKGVNELEVRAIMEQVRKLVQMEEELEPGMKRSIGILSPFRAQVDAIAKELSLELTLEVISDHRISVGTAYTFQGEERDIMLLSFCLDDASHHSAHVHLNKPDVFNVSLTRAKSFQYVYHSVDIKSLDQNHYLRMFLEQVEKGLIPKTTLDHEHDSFMEDVLSFLSEYEFKYWVYFSVAGIPIDIIIQTETGLHGVDLIGYPGSYRDALTVERYKIIGRAGVPVFPLPYTFWTLRNEECKEQLTSFLK